jgi:hypothetical protein
MASKSTPVTCTYCGQVKVPWDEDHVPPQSLIGVDHDYKVPSCIACNGGASKDDEYFLFAITMAKSCDDHPKISEIRERVFRSLGKERAKSYRDLILRNVQLTSGDQRGLDFGNYLDRIRAVASRIVKGLFFLAHGGERIPDNYQVTVFVGNEYRAYGTENVEKFQSLFRPLFSAEAKSVGDAGVFEYVHASIDGDRFATVWYLRFYGGYELFAHVLPHGDSRALATHFPRIHNMHLLPELATIFVPSCGELSDWVASQLGVVSDSSPQKATELPKGVTPILRGKLGSHGKQRKQEP